MLLSIHQLIYAMEIGAFTFCQFDIQQMKHCAWSFAEPITSFKD